MPGRAVPVSAHGRELRAHDQPQVLRGADQGVQPRARHRRRGLEAPRLQLLPGRLIRPGRPLRPLPARRAAVHRLGLVPSPHPG